MLWIYYAFLKPDASLLITINSIGCAIEAIYIITYLVFAPKNVKVSDMKRSISLQVIAKIVKFRYKFGEYIYFFFGIADLYGKNTVPFDCWGVRYDSSAHTLAIERL